MHDDESSWLSNLLLGWEYRQHRDVQRLKAAATDASLTLEMAMEQIHRQGQRIDRLELVTEALLEVIVAREVATREELGVLIAQIDLRDGVEDGAIIGEAPRQRAPLCGSCERPINPKREACVYCGAAITAASPAPQRPQRTVVCGGCGQRVEERATNFTAQGLRCDPCFARG